jgi:DNA-binding NarL/FixJ family response regulator
MREEIYNRLCYRPCFVVGGSAEPMAIEPAGYIFAAPIRVAMADGYPLSVNGMLNIISYENKVVVDGFIFNDIPLTDWYTGSNADVLLLDICLPVPNGINLIKQLLSRFPEAKIVVFSDEDDPGVIRCMQSLGAYAYQVKNSGANNVIQTIIKVHADEKVFPENLEGGIARSLIRRFIDPPPTFELSPREIQVLKLIANGKTNPQIAEELTLSPLTIKKHRENILRRLKATNTAQVISKARFKGLL